MNQSTVNGNDHESHYRSTLDPNYFINVLVCSLGVLKYMKISGTQCRDHCSILISWSSPCFSIIDHVVVWRGYCGVLISAFLWPLGNFFNRTGICQVRHRYKCVPVTLTNYVPLVLSMKNNCLPELSQVLPLQNRDPDISNSVGFSSLLSDTSSKVRLTNTEHFLIIAVSFSWLKIWIKYMENVRKIVLHYPAHPGTSLFWVLLTTVQEMQ